MDYSISRLTKSATQWLEQNLHDDAVRDAFMFRLYLFVSNSSTDAGSLDLVYSTAVELNSFGLLSKVSTAELVNVLAQGEERRVEAFKSGLPNQMRSEISDLLLVGAKVDNLPNTLAASESLAAAKAIPVELLSKMTLEASEKWSAITTKLAEETIAKLGDAPRTKADPSINIMGISDFASAAAEMAAENMAAFAEVARKVQMETIELILAAGKDRIKDTTAATKKVALEPVDKSTRQVN